MGYTQQVSDGDRRAAYEDAASQALRDAYDEYLGDLDETDEPVPFDEFEPSEYDIPRRQ